MDAEKLKPCPFCGDKPYTQVRANIDRIGVKIGCGNCDVYLRESMPSGMDFCEFYKIKNRLIVRWNRRTEDN